MSDLAKIKPTIRPTAIRPLHKEPEKKHTKQQKKETKHEEHDKEQKGGINEYI